MRAIQTGIILQDYRIHFTTCSYRYIMDSAGRHVLLLKKAVFQHETKNPVCPVG